MSDSPIKTPPPFSTIILNENEYNNENENTTENENENKTENENENNKENMRTSTFKISNQAITRRFTLSIEQPTWLELELKVREIFSIPSSVSPGLTYIDEGDDNITISSQIELEDYYKQVKCHEYSDNNIIYRFSLVIFTPLRDYADDDNDNGNNPPGYEEHEEHNVRVCPTQ
ncbi:unnamed protein product [Rhizophagus irregularis]|uniref:PB1 domain-containing protein n=1 Tax=Rhizophagus irregularis TaxID=588596 RepID=A0A2I1G192_9GLOM|nr:hypothetical protein RhiirA4_394570 [Rhizophagus irregularis]CAB4410220.1 unnamed protein product [Rhizophagus irregularis]